ncbi:MAG: S8 family serine peptidase [Putridiphycobacter sp.]
MKKIALFFTLLFSLSSVLAQNYYSDAIDGRVIFKLKDAYQIDGMNIEKPAGLHEVSKKEDLNNFPKLAQVLAPYGVQNFERPSYYTQKPRLIRIFIVDFANPADVDNVIRDLQALDIVEYAEKQLIRKTTLIPNDTYWDGLNNWYLTQVNAEQAFDISQGSNSVKVAIVDNAVFCNHEDLTTFAQRDVADGDNDATPPLDVNADFGWSHGTHCAGLATADINNAKGIASLGADVELIGVKCTPDNGSSNSVYYGYQGMQWACENGADVVSMSWGGPGASLSNQDLINSYPNIVFLAAAGNDNVTSTFYPGGYDNVICVGSVNYDDSRSSFSNYNPTAGTPWVDICSPGGYSYNGLMSTVYTASGDEYDRMGGTSMATPFAAGLVGSMLSVYPNMSPTEVLNCLLSSGVNVNQDMGPRIDAQAALQCTQALLDGTPNADFFADNQTIVVGNSVNFTDMSGDGGDAITTWNWTFTGGTPSSFSGQNPPAVTYNTIGQYTVELTITNGTGTDTETKTAYINVTEQPYGQWYVQNSGFATASRGITNFSIVDVNNVWALAYDGSGNGNTVQEFTRTSDGGATWTPGTIDIGSTGSGIAMIEAIDANTAYIVAYPNAGGDDQGIFKTTDGGATWTKQTSASYSNAASFSNVVTFWDANTGFCQGDPINGEYELYTTTDGGATWVPVPGADIPDPVAGEYGYVGQIERVGNHVWYSTNTGRLYHSTDQGYTWTVAQTPLTDFGSATQNGNFSFKDANNGMIVDNNANVYKTADGGATWSAVTPVGPVFTSGLCWIEGTDTIFTTGQNGSSYSTDAGANWIQVDNEQHTTVEFTNSLVGWSGWFNTSATSGGIWNWGNLSTLSPDFVGAPFSICEGESVAFTDNTTGGTPTSWNWSFPGGTPSSSTAQNPTVTYATAGNYDVVLTVDDGNGGISKTITSYITVGGIPGTAAGVIGNSAPTIGTVETYSVLPITGAVTYNWTLPSGWTGSSSTNSIDVTIGASTGSDVIECYASNNCGDGGVASVTLSPVVGLNELNNNLISVYPNPANEFIVISLNQNFENATYQLFDITGKIVMTSQITEMSNAQVSVANLSKGVYTLRLLVDGNVYNQKVVVE